MFKRLFLCTLLLGISLEQPLFGNVPSQFNAFFFGDFSCASSDTQGRLGAGGNINIQNYAVGCQIYNSNPQTTCINFGSVTCSALEAENPAPYIYSLVAGGSLSAVNTEVYAGAIAYGTTESSQAFHVVDCPDSQSNPIDFNNWKNYLNSLSMTISQLPPTGTVVNNYGSLTFNGNGSNPEVFFLPGSVLSSANGIQIGTGIAAGAAILINIDGTNVNFQNMGTTGFQNFANRVVFNFFQATSVSIGGIAVFGSILAPKTDFVNTNGVIWGQIFANSWGSQGSPSCAQINWVPFTPNVNFSPSLCGDGIVQGPEQCDLGLTRNGLPQYCCDVNCNLVPKDTTCRPSAGVCDIPEVCDGQNPMCPPDEFKPITTPCGDFFGICDLQLVQHCPGNAATCYGAPPAPLWYWDAFNVISFNNYSCVGGDIEGRLAVRNYAYLDSFTLGLKILPTDYYSVFALLVGYEATWNSGSVYNGLIGVGGTFHAPAYLQAYSIPSAISTQQFDAAQTYYETVQSLLYNLGTNAAATLVYGDGLKITCNNPSDILYHVQVDYATFNNVNWFILQNCMFSAGWIVDITGTGDVTIKGSPFPGIVERVVFNVIGNGRTISGQTGVGANILAPANSYVQNTGVTYGRVIVGNIPNSRQHNKPNCKNFQNITISNVNLKAIQVGDNFIYVVDLSNYVVGDLVCFNGDCHKVYGGVVGDMNNDGVVDHVLYVTPSFGQSIPPNTICSTTVDPNAPRIPLTPTQMTTQSKHSSANLVQVSLFLFFILFSLF